MTLLAAVVHTGCADPSREQLTGACRAVGLCDEPAKPPVAVDVLCDASSGSSCSQEALRRTLDAALDELQEDLEDSPVATVEIGSLSGIVLKRSGFASFTLPPIWKPPTVSTIPVVPGDETKPLSVKVFYQPDATVAAVTELAGWTDGFSWAPYTTNCDLAGAPSHCQADVGCLVTVMQTGAKVTLAAPGDTSSPYSCYFTQQWQYASRGAMWVETNHGDKVTLVPTGCDPPQNDGWCCNHQLPKGVVLE